MKVRVTTGARRWAKALLDVAGKDDPAKVQADLRGAVQALDGSPELLRVLAHPAVSPEKKKKVVQGVFAEQVGPLVLRLLTLLVEKRRLDTLTAIEQSFTTQWNDQRGVLAAEVAGAVALEGAQQTALAEALKRVTGRQIELTSSVEPELMGGLVVRAGGRTYDGSVRTRLRQLKEQLRGGPGA